MSKIKRTTIVFPINDDEVLLGMKKRGFGEGWWNGFGGKLEPEESFEDNAIRETYEEVGLEIADLQLVANLLFYFDNQLKIVNKAYVTRSFSKEPTETEEMRPKWFKVDQLPFDTMWPGDDRWIPEALALTNSDNPLNRAVYFDKENTFLSIVDVPKPEW